MSYLPDKEYLDSPPETWSHFENTFNYKLGGPNTLLVPLPLAHLPKGVTIDKALKKINVGYFFQMMWLTLCSGFQRCQFNVGYI